MNDNNVQQRLEKLEKDNVLLWEQAAKSSTAILRLHLMLQLVMGQVCNCDNCTRKRASETNSTATHNAEHE